MSAQELREHVKYLTDAPKLAAYREALRRVMPSDAVVVDLGCGTGLLGLIACQLGARKVYAMDGGAIIAVAAEVAAAAGFADRIEHIEAMSVDVTLPEPADVVVADQIGGLAYEAGVLEYYDDARRFLKPGGVMIPESFELRLAAVDSEREWRAAGAWGRGDLGFGPAFSPVARHAANTAFNVHCTADELLSDAANVRRGVVEREPPIRRAGHGGGSPCRHVPRSARHVRRPDGSRRGDDQRSGRTRRDGTPLADAAPGGRAGRGAPRRCRGGLGVGVAGELLRPLGRDGAA